MEVASISSLAQQMNGSAGEDAASRSAKEAGTGGEGDKRSESGLTPEKLYHQGRINRAVVNEYHGLNIKSAHRVLAGLAGQIRQSSPWGLAELQRVTGRNLIPSAYV